MATQKSECGTILVRFHGGPWDGGSFLARRHTLVPPHFVAIGQGGEFWQYDHPSGRFMEHPAVLASPLSILHKSGDGPIDRFTGHLYSLYQSHEVPGSDAQSAVQLVAIYGHYGISCNRDLVF